MSRLSRFAELALVSMWALTSGGIITLLLFLGHAPQFIIILAAICVPFGIVVIFVAIERAVYFIEMDNDSDNSWSDGDDNDDRP